MSGDRLLSSFADKVGASSAEQKASDQDAPENHGTFGWLRHNYPRMLELRLRNGNIIALGYGWLEQVAYDPSVGIELTFTGQRTIQIVGRNLDRDIRPNVSLLDGLIRHKVPWIAESATCLDSNRETLSTEIEAIQLR